MLVFLPLVSLLFLIVIVSGLELKPLSRQFWVARFLLAAALWGAFVVVMTEAASLFDGLTQTTFSFFWAVNILLLIVVGWRRRWLFSGWHHLRALKLAASRFELGLWIIFGALAGLLLAVAWVAPPNNADVMQYHLPRVLQWAQSKNLDHFPTIYDNQNTRPYWAELVVLNLRVLYGSDKPSAMLQWGSHLASMIAAAGIVKLLGGGRRSQWVSALFVFSLPMAVLQANTPKNDIVAGFWVLSLLYFVILGRLSNGSRLATAGISLSLGLGMLTKGTFMPFAFPVLFIHFLPLLVRKNFSRLLKEGLPLVIVMVALNTGIWVRNFNTYGGPYGSELPVGLEKRQEQGGSEMLTGSMSATTQRQSPLAHNDMFGVLSSNHYSSNFPFSGHSDQMITSGPGSRMFDLVQEQSTKVLRMIALNLMTPVKFINELILRVLALFPGVFPDGYIDSLRAGAWSYAMTTSNPVHIAMVLIGLIFVFANWRKAGGQLKAEIGIAALIGYFLMSFGGCSDWLICLRYQQGFFVIGSVLFAISADALLKERVVWVSLFLAIASVPYVLFNYLRPVIGQTPWPTRIESVFVLPADDIVFAHISEVQDEYEVIAARIQEQGCNKVGLSLIPRDFEYAIWWVLGAPDSGIDLQHISVSEATQKHLRDVEKTCAVICTTCGGQASYEGIPLVADYGHVQHFAQPDP